MSESAPTNVFMEPNKVHRSFNDNEISSNYDAHTVKDAAVNDKLERVPLESKVSESVNRGTGMDCSSSLLS